MASLLLVVFLLQLIIHLINKFGAGFINNGLWAVYNKLPASKATSVQAQTKLQREALRLKREMDATSSQDEFAKWAKLRRQHDKVLAEYEEKAQSFQSFQASFNTTVTVLRWLGTNGLRVFLQVWFSRQPLFWVPKGWAPWYVEWILSFPRAPIGSISIQVWGGACASVIIIVSDALVALWAISQRQGDGTKAKGAPMKTGAGTASGRDVKAGGREKEL